MLPLPPRSVMNLRRFMPAPTLRRPHFNGSIDCLVRASRHWSCLRWVKLRRTQYEHMFSGLPVIADIDGFSQVRD
jgi:hypothetical protein